MAKAGVWDRLMDAIRSTSSSTTNIPLKINRRWKPWFSWRLYRERNLIEQLFPSWSTSAASPPPYDKLVIIMSIRSPSWRVSAIR
jgi:hypothetical protein